MGRRLRCRPTRTDTGLNAHDRSSRDGLFHRGDDLPRRIAKIVGRDDRKPACREYVLALLNVRALQPDHQRILEVPLVVRLEGTNVEQGKKIINESGLNVVSANDLDDAAQKIVGAVKGA